MRTPRDIEGTALLSHAKILDADDQWLYLPALKRVKRISSSNKSGPFVGSEFAFEDFTARTGRPPTEAEALTLHRDAFETALHAIQAEGVIIQELMAPLRVEERGERGDLLV